MAATQKQTYTHKKLSRTGASQENIHVCLTTELLFFEEIIIIAQQNTLSGFMAGQNTKLAEEQKLKEKTATV